ncbi:MAG: rRNA pseudouridine synthase [Candidatus Eremiobacteraeota bacterium]|nr:rRNA pseudouridine synthase [Candidatus Eremiobacteraeota bacterium]
MRDERGRPCVGDLLEKSTNRLFPIGRLDAQTTGLLLCTSDGELGRNLAHPSSQVERTYRVTVAGKAAREALRRLGARTVIQSAHGTRFEMTLTSGANREIRRACAQQGLRVVSLERIAFGSVVLGDLAPGNYRTLSERETRRLRDLKGTT